MIDWEKPVQTRHGCEVVTCRPGVKGRAYSVFGYLKHPTCDQWEPTSWNVHGESAKGVKDFDLVNVPEKFDMDAFIRSVFQELCSTGAISSWEQALKKVAAKIMEQIEAKNDRSL